jgi:toxin ParE1/3/4
MVYQVSVLPRAARDLRQIYKDINAEHSDAALKWYRGLARSLRSLQDHPYRCALALEGHQFRQFLFGNKPHIYRVIFHVIEEQKYVGVLHVRHAARRKLEPADLV